MKISVDSFDVYPQVAFGGTCGSYGADASIEFEFGESWEGLSRVVTFYPADGGNSVSVVLGSDCVIKIPVEVMSAAGTARYVVSGVRGNETMISVTGRLYVAETLAAEGIAPGTVTPSVEAQILGFVEESERAAENAARSAAECADILEQFGDDIDTATTAAATASSAASAASSAAASAARSLGSCELARLSAEGSAQTASSAAQSASEASAAAQAIKDEVEETFDDIIASEEEREEAENRRQAAERERSRSFKSFSNAVRGNASDKIVKITDISPVGHEMDVKISTDEFIEGDDIIPYPYDTDIAQSLEVIYTYNGRTVTVGGYLMAPDVFTIGTLRLEPGRYKIGGFSLCSDYENVIALRIEDVDNNIDIFYEDIDGITDYSTVFEINEAIPNARISVQFLYPINDPNLSGSMTPYLILNDMSSVVLREYAKNLLPCSYSDGASKTVNGVTFTKKSDGSITLNGTATGTATYTLVRASDGVFPLIPGAAYSIRSTGNMPIKLNYTDAGGVDRYADAGASLVWDDAYTFKSVFASCGAGVTFDNCTIYPQVEFGSSATAFEPPVDPVSHTPHTDGTVEGVMSHYPTTVLVTDNNDAVINVEYNIDLDGVISGIYDDLDTVHDTIDNKANIDGHYEDMSVGNAEQLTSSVSIEDKVPYNFRTSGGSVDIGDRETDMIVGGTVCFNQLVDSNGSDVTVASGHKYFAFIGGIETVGSGDGSAITGLTGGTDMIVDLTLMFGATIADHVYSLETANAGDGVTWFKSLFPKDDYAYNAGTLISVKTRAHKTVGFNAYKHTDGTANLIGGKEYQISGTYTSLEYLDVNGDYDMPTIDEDGYFTPTYNGTLIVTGGNATDTCVHLVWDGERDGEFEEYVERVYALDGDLELRGLPKLDANNRLYYDGDTYASDGTVTRKYGIIDLGDCNWQDNGAVTGGRQYYIALQGKANGTSNMLCRTMTVGNDLDKIYGRDNSNIVTVKSPIESAAAFKSAMSGVYLVYELAEPATETADAYQNPQIVDDWGTEEYVDNRLVAMPVGHVTKYMPNLRAKLETAPNSPSQGDGDYIVRQTNGKNEYVKNPNPKNTFLLWENPNPNSAFSSVPASNPLSLNTSHKCNYFEILFHHNSGSSSKAMAAATIVKLGYHGALTYTNVDGTILQMLYRGMNVTETANQDGTYTYNFTFGSATKFNVNSADNTVTKDSSLSVYCVPIEIYGKTDM